MRIGHGFDVHAFGPGDAVTLGGVRIAHDQGLIAHSDGDVVLHALCDALLGAAGLPVPQVMQGRDATALAKGEEVDWEEEVFIQISEYTVGRALRTPRWKYCVHDPHRSGWGDPVGDRYVEHHLYDLYADPWEQVNLIGRKEYDGQRVHLKERLLAHMRAAGEAEVEILDGKFYE